MTKKHLLLALVLSLALPSAFATVLTRSDIQKAAEAFVNRDSVGASVLFGRTVKSVEEKDALFIVRLSPSGYIVFSGDTAAEPVIAFSTNDYTEEAGSPLNALLSVANENAQKARAKSAVDASMASLLMTASFVSVTSSDTRNVADRRVAKWAEFLGDSSSSVSAAESTTSGSSVKIASLLMATSLSNTSSSDVAPFLTTTWNQWQPYNDYAPVYSTGENDIYRGRCPCGCVATAYAQILKYWEWPKRFEEVVTYTHDAYDSSGAKYPFQVRFDGSVPFDWSGMLDKYNTPSLATSYDWRGLLAESNRYAVARLILCADVLAKMYFASESGANISTAAGANRWYGSGYLLRTNATSDEDFFNRIRENLEDGIPVAVSVPGHQVVAHGWKSDSGTSFVYLNYGWGGSSDGYFATSVSSSESSYITDALLDNLPILTTQINPLPVVINPSSSIDLKWTVPERLASEITGFTLKWKELGTETTSALQDFSDASWISTNRSNRICVTTSTNLNNDTAFLQITQLASGAVDLLDSEVMLTSLSELSYRVRYDYAAGLTIRVQLSVDGSNWKTVDVMPIWNDTSTSGWMTRKVFLGSWGGEFVRLRLGAETNGRYYIPVSETWGVQIDDVQVSYVLGTKECVTKSLDASLRNFSMSKASMASAFNSGSLNVFELTPATSSGLRTACGFAQTRIAGEASVLEPGAVSFVTNDIAYSAGAENWTLQTATGNNPTGSKAVLGPNAGALSLYVDGAVTQSSVFSFDWTSKNYFDANSYDEIRVCWTDADGSLTTLVAMTNTANQTSAQRVSVPLAQVAGGIGDIAIAFLHHGISYNSLNRGLIVQNAKVTDVVSLVKPTEIAWATETFAASTLPYIHSVTSISEASPAVQEGFYRECARGTNVFFVSCSENVTSLAARPSHLSLVPDAAVAVYPQGCGKFVVTVDGSGIDDEHDRSRLILTLVASDANGTTTAKDLSLRFSSATAAESYTPPAEEKTTSTTPIPVPHTWLVEKGLVSEGATDEAFEAAAKADQDSDGQPTYAEYLCGTDPTNKDDVFKIFIEMVDGDPMISWAPTNTMTKYTVIGVTNLVDRTWVETNAANRAGLRFFRVRATRR